MVPVHLVSVQRTGPPTWIQIGYSIGLAGQLRSVLVPRPLLEALDCVLMEFLYFALQSNEDGLRPALNGLLYTKGEFWEHYGHEQAAAYWTAAGLRVIEPVLVVPGLSADNPDPCVCKLVQNFIFSIAVNEIKEVVAPRATGITTLTGNHNHRHQGRETSVLVLRES